MKRLLFIALFIHHSLLAIHAQDIPPVTEQQLENLADADQAETEDDSYLQQLEYFKKQPINLNTADASELKELRILTDLQADNLIAYRRLFGNFISIYELQAVPSWDAGTIRKLLPFVTIALPFSAKENFQKRIRGGDHSLLLRVSQVLERSAGFDKAASGTKYLGSPQRVFFRYRYTYKNLLQFGIVGDKDAGEQFFKGAQSIGFDFYSFHLFVRKAGIIRSLAIGDFTVNMGQGLVQWQSLAFKKSAEVMGIKRQSPVLRPYNSAGEFNFHRGAGITISKGKFESTVFASVRKVSANLTADTLSQEEYITSLLTSGYNRTANEVADRNRLRQTIFGGTINYTAGRFHIGLNGIYYGFSLPVQKRDEPYNLYAINGDKWYNLSTDYSYTYKNLHFFGEAAIDKGYHKAFVNGVLVSVDPRIDVSLLHRSISKKYQAINANTFSENTYPSNESGLYAGIAIRPANGWRFDMYGDMYKFPWLKYLVDAPSYGKDFLVQLTYASSKQVEIYTRYRNENKQGNQADNSTVMNYLVSLPRQNWRTQISYRIHPAVTIRNRYEMIWYDKNGNNSENGFLTFFDFAYRPLLKPYSGVLRLQYFETDGYNSRLYAYENDVLYSYSIPVFYDKGYRYYLTVNYDWDQKISFWLRWAQTIYRGKDVIGSGLDEINSNKRSEVKVQIRVIL
ncbi:MAG: helix-hairpin-helix domain-containing protein [Chitinophagaceae bacterium]|nr:helix-hairpin-helix domain-containing protein [Chitinophagaceae bacterium]